MEKLESLEIWFCESGFKDALAIETDGEIRLEY